MRRTLVAVMSYERPDALEVCLKSIREVGGTFDVIVVDDQSSSPQIPKLAAQYDMEFMTGPGGSGRHGGLYENMELARQLASDRGYDYLAFFQDDMQLVRPFDAAINAEYDAVFARDEQIVCIDHRFTRGGFNGVFDPALNAYRYPRLYTYSDVAVFSLDRLASRGFQFNAFAHPLVAAEKLIKQEAKKLGIVKVSARTPVCMHIPFPRLIRNKITLPRLSRLSRKPRKYVSMSEKQRATMDARDPNIPPNFRVFLEFENLTGFDRWLMKSAQDSKIF